LEVVAGEHRKHVLSIPHPVGLECGGEPRGFGLAAPSRPTPIDLGAHLPSASRSITVSDCALSCSASSTGDDIQDQRLSAHD